MDDAQVTVHSTMFLLICNDDHTLISDTKFFDGVLNALTL